MHVCCVRAEQRLGVAAAGVSFIWCVVLSVMQGGPDTPKAVEQEQQQALSSPYEPSVRLLPQQVSSAYSRLSAAAPVQQASQQRQLVSRCGGAVNMRSLLPAHSAAWPLLS